MKKYISIQLISIKYGRDKLEKASFSNHSLKNSYMIELTDAFINYDMLLSFPDYPDSQK